MTAFQIRRASNTTEPSPIFTVPLTPCSVDDVLITPEIAAYLLKNHNANNRPVKETRVDQYATSMKLGLWRNVGERGLFDVKGNIISLQHRLLACVKSGVSIRLDLKFGLPEDAREVEGGGCARTAADQIRGATGDADAAFKVKVTNGLKKILNHRRTGTDGATSLAMFNDFSRGLAVILATIKGKSQLGRGPAAGALMLAAEAFPNKTRDFIESIQRGACTTTAAQALNAYLVDTFGGDKEDAIASKVLYAVYTHLTNKEIKRLTVTKHDEAVDYFVEAITRNHPIKTLGAIAPSRA